MAYAPPFGSAKDPINMLGYISENIVSGLTKTAQWHEIDYYRESGYALLDVRTSDECNRGMIPGFINIPVYELRAPASRDTARQKLKLESIHLLS